MKRRFKTTGGALAPGDRGFTLVELLMVILITAILTTVLSTTFVAQQRSATAQEQVVETQQNIRAGLNILAREIRMAGYDPNRNGNSGILAATANNLRFTRVDDQDNDDNDNDGTTDNPGELTTIQYSVYFSSTTGSWNLGRAVGPAPSSQNETVAMNIDGLEFRYTLANGTQTTTPASDDLKDIRSIQVSILARADRPDPDYRNQQDYRPASGTKDWLRTGVANPVDDRFRRRLLITTIHCRNMGL